MDFKELAQQLLPQAKSLVSQWLPRGTLRNNEWIIGNIQGDEGKSMHINLETGMWNDFNTGDKGGDLISLYAAVKNLRQYEAALELGGAPTPIKKQDLPDFSHKALGYPRSVHAYTDSENNVVMYTARYDKLDGTKEFFPFTKLNGKWTKKAIPNSRPIYNLYALVQNPDAPVLVVEGERTCELARNFITPYVIVSWSGGCQAINKTDWTPLQGRKKILLWPDADKAGIKAMENIAAILSPHTEDLKIIRPDRNSGWDAADAYQEGWTYDQWKTWAKELVEAYAPIQEPETTPNTPEVIEECFEVKVPKHMVEQLQADINRFKSMGLILNSKLKPIVNESNILKVLSKWDKLDPDFICFDEFHLKFFTKDKKEWTEEHFNELLVRLQSDMKLHNLSTTTLQTAISTYAYRNRKNEVKEFLLSLRWDGVERVDNFFTHCYESQDTPYTRAISRNFWLGLVARILKSGCKLDTMIVLEGPQGIKKSSSLKAIGGQWYAETNLSPDNKDFYVHLQGKALVEIGELSSFDKSQTTSIKQMLSCQIDRFRPPYGKLAQDFPRQCMFVGTTNDDTYLRDSTGNRRFWPIKTPMVHLERIEELREQYFAEAVYRLNRLEESWWEVPAEEATAQQDERMIDDEWQGYVEAYILNEPYTTIADIATKSKLNIKPQDINRMTQLRIASCLKRAGWERFIRRDGNNVFKAWKLVTLK